MSELPVEYLLRVRQMPGEEIEFIATIRQFVGGHHPEVRAVVGHVATGKGATAIAAMVSALAELQLDRMTVVREINRVD